MAILITGGAGFIGSHLTERLLADGRQVVCLDNFNDYYDPAVKRRNIAAALLNAKYTLVEGDILDAGLLDALFAAHDFKLIVHLAARAGVRPSLADPILYEKVNCQGTLNLLERARQAPLDHFVFGSSSSVYGINGKVPFSEVDPVNQPISPYAATKRAGELLCYTYHHLYGLPITCLRFFTVYGPRQRPDMAIHKFTRLIDAGEEITLFGDGKSRRDYTYVDDIIDGVTKAMDKPRGYKIYNLGESQTIELLDLIRLIESALGKEAKINWQPNQPGDVPITFADITLAKRDLGYAPTTPIESGIPRFVNWYLASPKS
ncbi:MAG: GDP-mannose 4,6-dehydratase [Actinomycetota bacterium]|nr:GDP-mannose 4,6-dehydratase [Actinomycetota bacterium]